MLYDDDMYNCIIPWESFFFLLLAAKQNKNYVGTKERTKKQQQMKKILVWVNIIISLENSRKKRIMNQMCVCVCVCVYVDI